MGALAALGKTVVGAREDEAYMKGTYRKVGQPEQ